MNNPNNTSRESIAIRQHSMRWRMAAVLVVCWMLPFAFLIGILGVYLAGNHSEMTVQNFQNQLQFNNKICVERLNAVIGASRQASYDRTLLSAEDGYRRGTVSYIEANRVWMEYLTANYQKNDAVSSAILWFGNGDEPDFVSVYNEQANGSYQQIQLYCDLY